ncbi:MAG: hypothetical protein J6Y97_03515 [Prevotella sp.]|nr:hypothetical protein [Prevotella sp.]
MMMVIRGNVAKRLDCRFLLKEKTPKSIAKVKIPSKFASEKNKKQNNKQLKNKDYENNGIKPDGSKPERE